MITMDDNSEYYNDYFLSKWSRYVRIRDNYTCVMCARTDISRRLLDAHHTKLKSVYPQYGLHLNNGVTLCEYCHMKVVHASRTNHKKFAYLFKRWNNRKAIKLFNQQYQYKLDTYAQKI